MSKPSDNSSARKPARSYSDCQSCGMPLKRDKQGGGTNRDGSKNTTYCSHCFASGEFTMPELSAAEMQARVKAKLREMGFPSIAAWFFARKVPKLARWNPDSDQ